jgi:hypothetical protein
MELAVVTEVSFEWLATARVAMQVDAVQRDGSAAESVQGLALRPQEEQLVVCYRQSSTHVQRILLELAEGLCLAPRRNDQGVHRHGSQAARHSEAMKRV